MNQKKRFYSKDRNKSVGVENGFCILFGNGRNSLQIDNNILSSNFHWSNPNGPYGDNLNLTESKDFSIIELEVFQIK